MSLSISSLIKKQRILLIPSPAKDIDTIAATFALGHALKKQSKHVGIYLEPDIYKNHIKEKFPLHDLSLVNLDQLRKLVITLSNFDADIAGIDWQKRDNKLDIFIDTPKNVIGAEDATIKIRRKSFDTTILVGFSDPQILNELYDQYPNFFKSENTIAISKTAPQGMFAAKHYPVFTPTISQTIFYFLKELEILNGTETATNLLAGLFAGTNSFSEQVNSNTFSIASQLVSMGGNLLEAKGKGLDLISLPDSRYFAAVFANLKTAGNGIYYSVVESVALGPTFTTLLTTNNVPSINIANAKVAMVILKSRESSIVYIKANTNNFDLAGLAKKFEVTPHGLNLQFVTDKDEQTIIKEVTESLPQLQSVPAEEPKVPTDAELISRMDNIANGTSRDEKIELKTLASKLNAPTPSSSFKSAEEILAPLRPQIEPNNDTSSPLPPAIQDY